MSLQLPIGQLGRQGRRLYDAHSTCQGLQQLLYGLAKVPVQQLLGTGHWCLPATTTSPTGTNGHQGSAVGIVAGHALPALQALRVDPNERKKERTLLGRAHSSAGSFTVYSYGNAPNELRSCCHLCTLQKSNAPPGAPQPALLTGTCCSTLISKATTWTAAKKTDM